MAGIPPATLSEGGLARTLHPAKCLSCEGPPKAAAVGRTMVVGQRKVGAGVQGENDQVQGEGWRVRSQGWC